MRCSVIVSAKNECPYMLEWVAYYKAIGFDDILLVTNDNTDRSLELYGPLQKGGYIHLIAHEVAPTQKPQKRAFLLGMDYLRKHLKPDYLFVADADEFLVLTQDETIQQYLGRLNGADGVCVNWRFFGSNGFETRPEGLVTENYTSASFPHRHVNTTLKSIAKFSDELLSFTAHFPVHKDPETKTYVFEDGTPFNASLIYEGADHHDWSKNSYVYAGIYHYGVKSAAEFQERMKRGRGAASAVKATDRPRHSDDYFAKFDLNEVQEEAALKLVPKTKALMVEMYQKCGLAEVFPPEYLGLRAADLEPKQG